MKVAFVSSFPPARGSLAEYADYFINDLKKHKEIEKIIILANKIENSKENEKSGKVEIVRCWDVNSTKIPFQLMKEIFAKKDEIDLVHFNLNMMNWGTSKLANLFGYMSPYLVKAILRKKTILTLHNLVDAIDLNKVKFIKPSFWAKLGLRAVTRILTKVDALTVTIKSYKKILKMRYDAENVYYIPHGFPEPLNRPIYNDSKTILLFGFLDPRKNLDLLIKIFQKIKSGDKDLRLIIAGSTHPKFPHYMNEAREKFVDTDIIFTGYVPQNKVKSLFASSSIVVLPYTVSVGSSGVLHLAASYGKPVVATKIRDLVKIVDDENFLVEMTSIKNLENSIKKVLYNEKIQRRMIEHNLKAARDLSFKIITGRFVDLYNKLLSQN